MKKLLAPLQVKVEEWKKNTSALEREHDKVSTTRPRHATVAHITLV